MVEALVALLLACLVMALSLSVLARQRRVQAALTARAELLATVRTARHLLGREARVPGGWRPEEVAEDSLSLRAFRGEGWVCPTSGRDGLLVHAWGIREPVAGEDSVMVYHPTLSPTVHLLTERTSAPGACPAQPDGVWERWRLSGTLPVGSVLVRYFHRGSYHLSDAVFRFRSGAGGRQPLTPPVLDGGASAFHALAGGVGVELVGRDSGDRWTVILREGAR